MKYYQEIEIEWHFPFAGEVAEYLYRAIGFQTTTGRPHYRMVAAWLKADWEKPALFYNTKRGLVQVFPNAEKLIQMLVELSALKSAGSMQIGKKVYHYVFAKRKDDAHEMAER